MRYEILVDAVFVHIGGGQILLKHIIQKLEKTNTKIFYLLDYRIKNIDLNISETNKVLYIKDSILKRHRFYKSNRNTYDKVLCFAHLPPSIRLKSKVITFLHQYSYLSLPKGSNFISRFQWFLKSRILSLLKLNTDKWIVQSSHVKDKMIEKYDIDSKKIDCLPFFRLDDITKSFNKVKNKFVYVSFPYKYKNHLNLIEGFVKSYKKNQKGELHLTVDNNCRYLIKKIQYYQKKNIPIVNHGLIKKTEVRKLYSSSEFLIFPSTMESFGLPLIEALEYGCKIIVSSLPYAKAISEPSLEFDPYCINEISNAFNISMSNKLKESKIIIKDETAKLIELLID